MRTPYLIQRCTLNSENGNTFDEIFSLDYMGSTEYEFGAVGKSLKRIRGIFDQFIYIKTDFLNVRKWNLFVAGDSLTVTEYQAYIPNLLTDKTRLKEPSHLDKAYTNKLYAFNEEKYWDKKDNPIPVILWWDIENDVFMYWGLEYGRLLKKAISCSIEKYGTSQN